MIHKELQWRTFDQLMDSVIGDMEDQSINGYTDPSKLIKVAQRVSKDLTLRIDKTDEQILDIENGKVKLPDNFVMLNWATVCFETAIEQWTIKPETTEKITRGCYPTDKVYSYYNECGDGIELFKQLPNKKVYKYQHTRAVTFKDSRQIRINCPNINCRSKWEAYIKDGYIYFNFNTGVVYINYVSTPEDNDGNLLVPDHEILNEYYEYAIKERILENMLFQGEQVGELLKYISQKRRNARIEAVSLVNTPDFYEMMEWLKQKKKVTEEKYFSMFKTYRWI